MKHLPRRALAAVCAAALLSAGAPALAAESADSGICVQLDGQTLSFTDVVPEVLDGRTFLPFRAVFEAMGAEVSYSASSQTVTATRDGTTVTMALGGTVATVEKNGVTTQITMDVAPYAYDNRTFVPVRFAAQAFGCAVGWDQDDQTVILIDTQKLVEDALAKYDFTYLNEYLAYSQKYSQGIWDLTADFDASFSLMGADPVAAAGTVAGTMADDTQVQLAMTLLMDLQSFMDSVNAQLGEDAAEPSAEEQAMLDSLKEDGIQVEVRGDLEQGVLYYTMDLGGLNEAAGLDGGTWYSMDVGALYADMGVDLPALLAAVKNMDYADLIALALSLGEPDDKDTAYADLAAGVDLVAQMLCDDAFAVSGSDRILHYNLNQDGVSTVITFTLHTDDSEVVGYDLTLELAMVGEDGSEAMSLSAQASMDEQDQMEASVQMDLANFVQLTLNMTGSYAEGDTAPETEPPAGATVVDLFGAQEA